mmetsp:Transcript_3880/g.10932  ORF Transcript_3880/g.10932 Transcript_3880/m.10932 type:complete len:136 (+) Transcript_3880:242-649(+)
MRMAKKGGAEDDAGGDDGGDGGDSGDGGDGGDGGDSGPTCTDVATTIGEVTALAKNAECCMEDEEGVPPCADGELGYFIQSLPEWETFLACCAPGSMDLAAIQESCGSIDDINYSEPYLTVGSKEEGQAVCNLEG